MQLKVHCRKRTSFDVSKTFRDYSIKICRLTKFKVKNKINVKNIYVFGQVDQKFSPKSRALV